MCRSTDSSRGCPLTAGGRSRPMERLFAARQLAYAQAHLRVDATGARAEAVAERIMDGITQMERRPL